ncbi:MAG: hypothetical protein N2376_03205 [Clostridia bacterium]|nr:hypothetical protein [Clostridia bacterium]
MQVAFWSNYHQTGTTYSMAAISTIVALEYRLRILLCHNQYQRSGLETCFIDKDYLENEVSSLSNLGIDALCKYIKYSKADKQDISSYTTTLMKNKFELLIGTTITNKGLYYKDLNEVIDPFLALCKECYDINFVDLSTESNELTQKIIQHSDVLVINLTQNTRVVEDFLKNYKDIHKKCIFVLGRYDKDSRYNAKSLQRKYTIKDPITVIPYNTEYADACAAGGAIDFIMRNLKSEKDDPNYQFVNEIRRTAGVVLNALNIDIELKKLGD